MKYRITIDKIEPKKKVKELYYPDVANKKGEKGVYADTEVVEEESSEIYQQTIEKEDFNIKTVIDAFNEGIK